MLETGKESINTAMQFTICLFVMIGKKAEEKVSFKINRPYAEGYRIVFDAIYRDSRAYNWPLNTEFDETDTMTVTPRWALKTGLLLKVLAPL